MVSRTGLYASIVNDDFKNENQVIKYNISFYLIVHVSTNNFHKLRSAIHVILLIFI